MASSLSPSRKSESELPYFGFSNAIDSPIGDSGYTMSFDDWDDLIASKKQREREARRASAPADVFADKFQKAWKYSGSKSKKSWEERLQESSDSLTEIEKPVMVTQDSHCEKERRSDGTSESEAQEARSPGGGSARFRHYRGVAKTMKIEVTESALAALQGTFATAKSRSGDDTSLPASADGSPRSDESNSTRGSIGTVESQARSEHSHHSASLRTAIDTAAGKRSPCPPLSPVASKIVAGSPIWALKSVKSESNLRSRAPTTAPTSSSTFSSKPKSPVAPPSESRTTPMLRARSRSMERMASQSSPADSTVAKNKDDSKTPERILKPEPPRVKTLNVTAAAAASHHPMKPLSPTAPPPREVSPDQRDARERPGRTLQRPQSARDFFGAAAPVTASVSGEIDVLRSIRNLEMLVDDAHKNVN